MEVTCGGWIWEYTCCETESGPKKSSRADMEECDLSRGSGASFRRQVIEKGSSFSSSANFGDFAGRGGATRAKGIILQRHRFNYCNSSKLHASWASYP